MLELVLLGAATLTATAMILQFKQQEGLARVPARVRSRRPQK